MGLRLFYNLLLRSTLVAWLAKNSLLLRSTLVAWLAKNSFLNLRKLSNIIKVTGRMMMKEG